MHKRLSTETDSRNAKGHSDKLQKEVQTSDRIKGYGQKEKESAEATVPRLEIGTNCKVMEKLETTINKKVNLASMRIKESLVNNLKENTSQLEEID